MYIAIPYKACLPVLGKVYMCVCGGDGSGGAVNITTLLE